MELASVSLTFRVARRPPEVGVLEDKSSLVVSLQLIHLFHEQLPITPTSAEMEGARLRDSGRFREIHTDGGGVEQRRCRLG